MVSHFTEDKTVKFHFPVGGIPHNTELYIEEFLKLEAKFSITKECLRFWKMNILNRIMKRHQLCCPHNIR